MKTRFTANIEHAPRVVFGRIPIFWRTNEQLAVCGIPQIEAGRHDVATANVLQSLEEMWNPPLCPMPPISVVNFVSDLERREENGNTEIHGQKKNASTRVKNSFQEGAKERSRNKKEGERESESE